MLLDFRTSDFLPEQLLLLVYPAPPAETREGFANSGEFGSRVYFVVLFYGLYPDSDTETRSHTEVSDV